MWYLSVSHLLAIAAVVGVLLVVALFRGEWKGWVRNWVLLGFSVGFLGWYSGRLAVFYLAYALVNYGVFWVLARVGSGRRVLFAGGILLNVGVVFLFRLIDLGVVGSSWYAPVVYLGLIYNVLKAINTHYYAYYMEKTVAFTHYLNYMLFIPTFTSGPILKLKEFDEDLERSHRMDGEAFESGVKRIVRGLFKKIVLVAVLMGVYEKVLAGELNAGESALLLATYYILLYFDFSGYSDLAIGFGTLMGFRVPENFKKPFSSPTLTQFWRNWHATLGDWFRDHVFVPVSRSVGQSRVFAAVMSMGIMLLVGVWHGFNWLFVLWGVYHGVLLLGENLLGQTMVNKRKVSKGYFVMRCVSTNVLVAFGTIFFSKDLATAGKILRGFAQL